jgi:hypothetical protein
MDEGLFKKYSIQVQKNKDVKEDILVYIQEKTALTLTQEEVTISKKVVTIQTSSVKRSLLLQKKIKEVLLEKGYVGKI